jgi:MFS family permease
MSVAVNSSIAARAPSADVRRLAAAQAISFAGGTSAYVALTASIYARTGSAVWVAAVAAVSFGLPSLASPLAGALGDRHDRRRVMVCSDLLGAACFVGLALLSAPAALVGAKALAALAAAPFFPAAAASVPRLTTPGGVARANATVSAAGTAGSLAGPLIGGAITAVAGAPAVFLLNAATFLASAALIGGIGRNLRAAGGAGGPSRNLTAGLRLLADDPVLRPLMIGFALLMLGMGTTLPAELVRAHELGFGAAGYGSMIAAWSAGGLVGARLAGRLLGRLPAGLLMVLASGGFALAFLTVAVAPWLALALAGLGAGGLAEGLAEVVHLGVIQRRAPDAVLSRAFAARSAVEQVGFSLSFVYAGSLVEGAGAAAAFGLAAGLCALGAAVLARALGRLPEGEVALDSAGEEVRGSAKSTGTARR